MRTAPTSKGGYTLRLPEGAAHERLPDCAQCQGRLRLFAKVFDPDAVQAMMRHLAAHRHQFARYRSWTFNTSSR